MVCRGRDARRKTRRDERLTSCVSLYDASNERTALLKIKLCDPEEHVRDTTCKIFGHLDYETTLHHVSKATLKDLSARMMDKRVSFCSPFRSGSSSS